MKLVVAGARCYRRDDADAGARCYRRDDADAGARRSKTVVANAGARWKKRGRRGVDVAELFVRSFGNNDDRKRKWYRNEVRGSRNWNRNCVRVRRHLRKYRYRRTIGVGVPPSTGDGEEAGGNVVVAIL